MKTKIEVKVGDTDCAFIDSEENNNIHPHNRSDCKQWSRRRREEEWTVARKIKESKVTLLHSEFTGVPYS